VTEPIRDEKATAGWAAAAVVLCIVGAIWFVFGQVRDFAFVGYDDHEYVFENAMITNGVSPIAVEWAFTRVHAGNWHPLATLSHMLDCQFFGLNAGAHHLTSVLLHTVTALLLFLLCRRLTGMTWASGIVALLFAIHPLRVESVAWVSERKDVLSGLFFVLAILAYDRHVQTGPALTPASGFRQWRSRMYWLSVVFFVLGSISKPMLVTFPFVLLLLDIWPWSRLEIEPIATFGRRLRPLVIEKIPFILIMVASCVATVLAQGSAIVPTDNLSLGARAANAAIAYATYLGQMIWPARLAVLYPYPDSSALLGSAAIAILVLAAISALVWKWHRPHPYLLAGWLWYLGMLIPVIGLVQVGQQAHADRYTYLPQIGVYLALVLSFERAVRGRMRLQRASAVAAAAILPALTWTARQQTTHWRDSDSLWSHTLASTGPNPMAHAHWGASLFRAGRTEEAIQQLQAALRIAPYHLTALNNLGLALLRQGDKEAAAVCFDKVLERNPQNPQALLQLGLLASNREEGIPEALRRIQAAIAVEPRNATLRIVGAQILIRAGRMDEAIAQATEAIRLMPLSAEAHCQLAVALAARGRIAEAMEANLRVLRLQPDHAEAHRNLGNLLLLRGQANEAIGQYQESLRIKPLQARTHFCLGVAFATQQRYQEAIGSFNESLKLAPGDAETHKNLGLALSRLGRNKEAVEQLNEALRLKPDYEEAKQALQQLNR
jgi:tetratricopeptide (TPR) repeat protein